MGTSTFGSGASCDASVSSISFDFMFVGDNLLGESEESARSQLVARALGLDDCGTAL
jgi:hypothetical protein